MTDLQTTVYSTTYSRWVPSLGRREMWPETVERVITFLRKQAPQIQDYSMTHVSWSDLSTAMLAMEVLPSMRIVQMAGPTLDRCQMGSFNCAATPITDWKSFTEILYVLMQGTGMGFSVEERFISQLPTIGRWVPGALTHWQIEDSTEGWCNALGYGLANWADGCDVEFDYSLIRPYGTPLKTKGGKASGPEPLKNLLDFVRTMMKRHQGRKLSSLNCHDIACYCGSIVQVGGVRRAAEISLSDRNDEKMKKAKMGQFWLSAPERSMANNSAVYESKPTMGEFFTDWQDLMNSGTGERGIFNREGLIKSLPERRNPYFDFLTNPCSEINLRPRQTCNLSIAVARSTDTIENLVRKIRLATVFGIVQSTLTNFQYVRDEWKQNCDEERLLGVDITGQMDCPLFTKDPATTERHYTALKHVAVTTAQEYAELFNINMPASVTCVKPSGNSSQFLDTSSGIHPRFAPYYIRRVRIASSNPVSQFLINAGVPHFPEVGDSLTNPMIWVFEFPVKSPDGAITRNDITALQMLEQWKLCKENYTEHMVSITVPVKDDEWMAVGAWVYKNWDTVTGISFLNFNGGVYSLAPYESITQADYDQRMKQWPTIDWTQLANYETTDMTDVAKEYSCLAGQCEI